MVRTSRHGVHGPGDLTLTAVVLFTVGAYGVAAGAVAGDETVVAIGVFALTVFATGIVWPVAALARLQLEVTVPADATVGDEVPVRIGVRGAASRLELRVLDPPGRWWRTGTPATVTLPHLATRRGVFDHVRVQVRTSAPLGVFVRVRQARVRLAAPLTVAPRPRAAAAPLHAVPKEAGAPAAAATPPGAADAVRAVRPYVPGDTARLVHWPTSARAGVLVVREHEPPGARGTALVVDLTGPAEWAEEAAAVAAGAGRAVLATGGRLVVATRERAGPRCAPVTDARELGRRLARAVAGTPARAPDGWPVHAVRAVEVGPGPGPAVAP